MKTNKAYTKRLRVTPTGKVLAGRPGGNHYNAKESRSTQLARKTQKKVHMTPKTQARFLPGKAGR